MKVIDEKGRLFGKINLVDLLIVLLVLLIAVAFCYKILGSKAPGDVATEGDLISANEEVTVRYEVLVSGIHNAYVEAMEQNAVGASLVRDNNVVNGKIVGFRKEPCLTALDKEANITLSEDQQRYDLFFTVEYTGKMHQNALMEGKQLLRIGSPYILRTIMIEIEGYLTSVEILEK